MLIQFQFLYKRLTGTSIVDTIYLKYKIHFKSGKIMMRESGLQANILSNKTSSLSLAKILMALAFYIFITATLLEHFNVVFTLKTLAFMLCGHAFYFLWKAQQVPD